MTFRTLTTFLLSTSLLLLMAACGATDGETEDISFGAQYNIVVSDELPAITNGDISIEVSYTACEGGHEFDFNSEETGENSFRVWLTKVTPNDECPDLQSQVLQFPIPEEALNGRITLSGPNVDLVVQEG